MSRTITSEILAAYSQCPRKAFLLHCTDEQGVMPDYMRVIEQRRLLNKQEQMIKLKQHVNGESCNSHEFNSSDESSRELILRSGDLEASCDALIQAEDNSSVESHEPLIIIGTYGVNKEDELKVLYAGYVLGEKQKMFPSSGTIITMKGKSHKVKLEKKYNILKPIITVLRDWSKKLPSKQPPVILNEHCRYCQFQSLCKTKAEQEDNLSLMKNTTPKIIQRYKNKGIFTINQLSYLFKPRKSKRGIKNATTLHKLELQAFAIRTGKIYLQEVPSIPRNRVEIFLDIEGIPDQDSYYLIGLEILNEESAFHYQFWADDLSGEERIWREFLEKAKEYPEAPIYHYGSYDSRAINKLAKRYRSNCEEINNRLVNVNSYIYGKVYFPVMSNSLKNIGKFLGASWTADDASGLQSLVWRYVWEETQDHNYKQTLLLYNKEDCSALRLLVDELSKIIDTANIRADIDFADHPKHDMTETGGAIYDEFAKILRSAHATYERNKISFRKSKTKVNLKSKKIGAPKGHRGYSRITPKGRRTIHVPKRIHCPNCEGNISLTESDRISEWVIVDIVLTQNGCRKTTIKYQGIQGYCPKCYHYYSPYGDGKGGAPQLFGHGFQAWVIYQRLTLRLSYGAIIQSLEDQFNEKISGGTIVNFIHYFKDYYAVTEKYLTEHILSSPFIHADETKINIRGSNYYVWVFTDGEHVIFKLTNTREADIVHSILTDYDGVLISDFYGGYDSVKCKQQKCLVHLIRDLNEDLWKSPFDGEFETFVLDVRNLIVSILDAVNKHGLKTKHLIKFKKNVDVFYEKTITNKTYYSETTIKYQKRFIRYSQSLFTFLEQDSIPWNNNMAERAIRHLAIQRKISGSFYEAVTHDYLLLLGISQTCRFQNKSMLAFLMSKERDLDKFKPSKRIRNSKPADLR